MRNRIKIKVKKPAQLISTTIRREGDGELARSIDNFKAKAQETPMKLSKAAKLIALLF